MYLLTRAGIINIEVCVTDDYNDINKLWVSI